jgi:hypothetical protein
MEMDLDESTYSDSGTDSGTWGINYLDDIPEDFNSVLIPALIAASATLSLSPENNPPPEPRTLPSPQVPQHLTASPVHKSANFSILPTEIRTMIWRLARPPPRIVRVRRATRGYPAALISNAEIPNLLHINKESRKLALGWYQLCFGDPPFILTTGWNIPNCRPHVYFDFSYDIFYAGCEKCFGLSCDQCVAVTITRDVEKVQNVLFHCLDIYLPFMKFVRLFPNAREIIILIQKEALGPGAKLSQLKEIGLSLGPPSLLGMYMAARDADKKNREKYVAERIVLVKIQEAD